MRPTIAIVAAMVWVIAPAHGRRPRRFRRAGGDQRQPHAGGHVARRCAHARPRGARGGLAAGSRRSAGPRRARVRGARQAGEHSGAVDPRARGNDDRRAGDQPADAAERSSCVVCRRAARRARATRCRSRRARRARCGSSAGAPGTYYYSGQIVGGTSSDSLATRGRRAARRVRRGRARNASRERPRARDRAVDEDDSPRRSGGPRRRSCDSRSTARRGRTRSA